MKKLLLILLLVMPVIAFSQNKISLKTGETFIGDVEGFYGENLVFKHPVQVIGSDRVHISEVYSIAGETPKSRQKAILKKNPKMIFLELEKDFTDPIYFSPNLNGGISSSKINNSAGDLLQLSGKLKLSAFGIGVFTGVLVSTEIIPEPEAKATLGLIGGLAGLACYIAGDIVLINAGKALNRDAITMSAASEGIGLAINF